MRRIYGYNPIGTVNGEAVAPPSAYEWGLESIQGDGAGMTEDLQLHTNRLGQRVVLNVEWQGLSGDMAAKLLRAFSAQYVTLCYYDPKSGGYETAEFVPDGMSAPLYNMRADVWDNVAITLTQRMGVG